MIKTKNDKLQVRPAQADLLRNLDQIWTVKAKLAARKGIDLSAAPEVDPLRWNLQRMIDETGNGAMCGLILGAAWAAQAAYDGKPESMRVGIAEKNMVLIMDRDLGHLHFDRETRAYLSVGRLPEGDFSCQEWQIIKTVQALAEFILELRRVYMTL